MIIESTRLATREELIQRINELEKQLNKEKEKNKELTKELLSKSGIYKIEVDFNKDYISKDKIRDKIEELEKIRKSMEDYLLVSSHSLNIQAVDEQIIVLQELLEERN